MKKEKEIKSTESAVVGMVFILIAIAAVVMSLTSI